MPESINLSVTPEEANYILMALSQRPLAEVAALFTKVKTQAEAQVRKGGGPIDAPPST